ncbi:MAG: crossover junction endodeoxyribonuclease RuvC [Alphaproteobacteria bacterium]|jgi:crossover junction endodeoxyribonuclease RuvC|nr:crossover junction endodeoxyribonuclease RuvC [Alphaproteobacteria bacterium]
MRLIGIDPGLQRTGWGVLSVDGSRLSHVGHGVIVSDAKLPLAERLRQLYQALTEVLVQWQPAEAAVEETFVNKNPTSTLKLGQARGVLLLAPAMAGIPVSEYTPNLIKKSVVGTGHAQKAQVAMMVTTLLPAAGAVKDDAADALAVAICHAHLRRSQQIIAQADRKADQKSGQIRGTAR